MNPKEKHQWKYNSVGGVVRVSIESGEDIAHLGELDQKKWTVLSCPVEGLIFEPATLKILDSDADGKIKAHEVVAAAQWLTSMVKDSNKILEGNSEIDLSEINDTDPEGKEIIECASRIKKNMGASQESICLSEAVGGRACFDKTPFNGDGVITPAASDDPAISGLIQTIMKTVGSIEDKSGEQGVNEELINNFYNSCTAYSAWLQQGEESKSDIFPYGDNTAAAADAFDALKSKVEDFFVRCKLLNFNQDAGKVLDVAIDKIAAIASGDLSQSGAQIADLPLARPDASGKLAYATVNPAWKGAFDSLVSLVLSVDYPEADSLTEDMWQAIGKKLEAFNGWKSGKKGAEVESLGCEAIGTIIKEDKKADLLALVEKDKSFFKEADGIAKVCKLLYLYRDFFRFVSNYVTFTDFYSADPLRKPVFNTGELYIDQRCCKLCINVADMSKHADMAAQSCLFLIYCDCVSKVKAAKMSIVALMTDGSTKDIKPGKNAVFYDRDGLDWDAVVTKVVDNPISIKAAFWSPYNKFINFVTEKINKSAADREAKVMSDMQSKANTVPVSKDEVAGKPKPAQPQKPDFDIAKFAGIFAAIGMALGYLGAFLTKVVEGAVASPLGFLCVVLAIMLCISGPSCFIAWTKLRKRNLGPILNANGWAVNSVLLINIMFGATLTSVAKYPLTKFSDPFKPKKMATWKKVLIWLAVLAIAVATYLLVTHCGNGSSTCLFSK